MCGMWRILTRTRESYKRQRTPYGKQGQVRENPYPRLTGKVSDMNGENVQIP